MTVRMVFSLAFVFLVLLAFSSPAGAASESLKNVTSGKTFFEGADYVGSNTCKGCHPNEYENWKNTWHALMEQWATPENVLGDFNNTEIVFKGLEVESLKGGKEKINATVRLSTDGKNFFFTLVDKDNKTNSQTYQVIKTLGGKWDQHYETKIGENYFPTPMRWAVGDKAWLTRGLSPENWFSGDGTPDGLPRKPEQLSPNRSAEAKCSGCHMTGYTPEYYKDAKRWKGTDVTSPKPELGITCEKCHGPGSLHIASPIGGKNIIHPLKDLNRLQQMQLCGQCHGRNTNKKEKELAFPVGFLPGDTNLQDIIYFWSYSGTPDEDKTGYFWRNDWAKRNRQQWQDFTKSTHFTKTNVTCITCHNPHKASYDNQLRFARDKLCIECHTEQGIAKSPDKEMFEGSPMSKAGVTCVDCHMPKMGTRTTETPVTKQHWDVSSHTFIAATPALTLEYGMRNSCEACHTKGTLKNTTLELTPEAANSILKSRQVEVNAKVDKAQKAISEAEEVLASASPEQAKASLYRAKSNVDFVLLDGSVGFHNYGKAISLLEEAISSAEDAKNMASGVPKKNISVPSALLASIALLMALYFLRRRK